MTSCLACVASRNQRTSDKVVAFESLWRSFKSGCGSRTMLQDLIAPGASLSVLPRDLMSQGYDGLGRVGNTLIKNLHTTSIRENRKIKPTNKSMNYHSPSKTIEIKMKLKETQRLELPPSADMHVHLRQGQVIIYRNLFSFSRSDRNLLTLLM